MSIEANRATELRYWTEVMRDRRFEVLEELFSPALVDHGMLPGQGVGVDGVRNALDVLFAGSSDLTYKVEDVIAEGERVVVRWSASGTHDGAFFGAPPTGATITGKGITIHRYEDGKIVESWNEYDTAGLMQQLGLVPS